MAFKPANSGGGGGSGDFEPFNAPVPKDGSRKARVSLIIDMGIQNREDFEDEKTGEKKPQKPCHQLAMFADLVADNVDYGGKIGKQQYRLPLHRVFKGVHTGINFTASPPKDADGKLIEGKPWGWHPASVLSKLAKATNQKELIEEMDVEKLLDVPFMAQVEVKKTEAKDKKKDKDGNVIVYTNVNFKGAAPVPTQEDEDGNEVPLTVAELKQPARCVTFDNATVDDIKVIRSGIIKQIKLANNYAGSQMQKAIEEFEAAAGGDDEGGEEEAETPPAKPAKVAAAKKVAAKAPPVGGGADDDVPFANPYRGKLSYLV